MERVANASPKLGKLLTARLRRAASLRAAELCLIGAATAVAGLEIAAKIVIFDGLRTAETLVIFCAAIGALALYLRTRPPASAWRAAADAMSGEPGVFSAGGDGAVATRLSPLVEHRAEEAAAALLQDRGPRARISSRARLAALAVIVAGAVTTLPGRRTCSDDLELRCLQDRIVSDVRALSAEAGKAQNAAEKSVFDRASKTLDGSRLTVESARRLAEELKAIARDRATQNRDLARDLAKDPLLREVADALEHEDEDALARAIESLAARVREMPPRGAATLEAASLLLKLAASVGDADLKKALADAGHALAAGEGSGDATEVSELGKELCRRIRSSQSVEDVVVSLESAEMLDAGGDAVPVRPRGDAPAEPLDPSKVKSGSGMPSPEELRSMVRPGTSDEAVLSRYFSVR